MNGRSALPGERVFAASRFDVRRCDVRQPDGTTWRREYVAHPGAVVILPLVNAEVGSERVVMIRNQRFAVDETLYELPAGTLEPGEEPVECAGRELIEEAGYRAAKIDALTAFYTNPGICNERMWAFLATDLSHVGQQLEANEHITVEVVPYDEAMQKIRKGVIQDGKTIATLLYYGAFRAALTETSV